MFGAMLGHVALVGSWTLMEFGAHLVGTELIPDTSKIVSAEASPYYGLQYGGGGGSPSIISGAISATGGFNVVSGATNSIQAAGSMYYDSVASKFMVRGSDGWKPVE